jgi:Flp pilus assembly protein TadB
MVVFRDDMHTVSSFHASSVAPAQIRTVVADYLAFERAQNHRRVFVTRFGLLAVLVGIVGLGFHWLPSLASLLGVGLCVVPPAWAWIAELRCDARLTRTLNELPNGAAHLVLPRRA